MVPGAGQALEPGACTGWGAVGDTPWGSDVTGVTLHPPVGPDVEASVENGRFSAWWPRGVFRGDRPGAGGAWSYLVTLADGSTRRVTG